VISDLPVEPVEPQADVRSRVNDGGTGGGTGAPITPERDEQRGARSLVRRLTDLLHGTHSDLMGYDDCPDDCVVPATVAEALDWLADES